MSASGNIRTTQLRSGDRSGTGSKVGTVTGTLTTGKQIEFDGNGNLVASAFDVGGANGTANYDPSYTLPPTSGWTAVNQGSSTFDFTYDYGYLSVPASASDSIRAYVRSATAPFTLVIKCDILMASGANFTSSGICLRDSVSGKIIVFGVAFNGGTRIYSYYHASATGSGSGRGTAIPTSYYQPMWLKVVDNSTNRIYYWSADGNTWETYDTTLSSADLTPNQVGFFGNTTNNSLMRLRLLSWSLT